MQVRNDKHPSAIFFGNRFCGTSIAVLRHADGLLPQRPRFLKRREGLAHQLLNSFLHFRGGATLLITVHTDLRCMAFRFSTHTGTLRSGHRRNANPFTVTLEATTCIQIPHHIDGIALNALTNLTRVFWSHGQNSRLDSANHSDNRVDQGFWSHAARDATLE